MKLNELIYVCVVSNYNLPEFESCLLRRPKHVVLVVSDYQKAQEGAERLEQQLEENLVGVRVHRPDISMGRSFNGQSFVECQQWIEDVLMPYLSRLPNLPRICNVTGGTKLYTLALAVPNLGWQQLDYKGTEHFLQVFEFEEGKLVIKDKKALGSALPYAVAKINSWQVVEVPENHLIKLKPELSLTMAKDIWQALSEELSTEGKALRELFGDDTYGLEAAWSYGRFTASSKRQPLELSTQTFLGKERFSEAEKKWLWQWVQLAPKLIGYTDDSIVVASRAMKDDFKRWLAGDWLEQLTQAWLLEKLPRKTIAANLKINPLPNEKSSTGERETDIVVHHKGVTTVIEVKADLAPGHGVKDLLQQITSLGERLGKTRKVLMIGPQLQDQIKANLKDVKRRCEADEVILCQCKEELLSVLVSP